MKTYDLTPKQIKEIDEISFNKISAEHTLKIALNFHSNRVNKIAKQEKDWYRQYFQKWWNDMAEVYGLDKTKEWKVDFESPVVCIREMEGE